MMMSSGMLTVTLDGAMKRRLAFSLPQNIELVLCSLITTILNRITTKEVLVEQRSVKKRSSNRKPDGRIATITFTNNV